MLQYNWVKKRTYKLQLETGEGWRTLNRYRNLSPVKAEFYVELSRLSKDLVSNPVPIRAVENDF